jgi:FtsH-binding integral membrane protein
MNDTHTSRRDVSWKYAFIGGVISIPFTVIVHAKTGSGIEFSSGTMVLGGGVAGYLAKRDSARAGMTGALAGAIGGLPLLWWWSSTFQYIIFSLIPVWPDTVSQVVRLFVIDLIIFFGTVLAGWLGGRLGGWLSERVDQ